MADPLHFPQFGRRTEAKGQLHQGGLNANVSCFYLLAGEINTLRHSVYNYAFFFCISVLFNAFYFNFLIFYYMLTVLAYFRKIKTMMRRGGVGLGSVLQAYDRVGSAQRWNRGSKTINSIHYKLGGHNYY